jgi:adenosylcobinamide-phosphate synthase
MMQRAATVSAAVVLDWLLGEPPAALHPVVWLGNTITLMERSAPFGIPHQELWYGAAMSTAAVGMALVPALLIEEVLPPYAAVPLAVVLLTSTLSWRTLLHAGARVQHALERDDLDAARAGLRWLVSRDASHLDSSQIAAAAIESLAENASDSVVAPLCYYSLFGLRGACIYRAINTLDAMIGYRGRYEYLGKVAARLDDLFNLVPARLTGALVVVVAGPRRGALIQAWRTMQRDHHLTASPNAGYPMSALAGALGVCLEKVGHYCLNEQGRAPTPRCLCPCHAPAPVARNLAGGL